MARPDKVFFLMVMCVLVHCTSLQCVTENDAAMINIEEGRREMLRSQLQFSADLLRSVGSLQPSDNVFFSPSSVYNAFLLAYFASANQTEVSLKKVLRISEKQSKIDTLGAYSLEKYYQTLRSIRDSLKYQQSSANRMYVSGEQGIRPCMKKYFTQEIETADFKNNVSDTVMRINSWVSGQTRKNINNLLSPDSLNSNTNLVLVNAAYFKGIWKKQFSPSETREGTFYLGDGTTTPVKMMSIESNFSHWTDEKLGAEVLELPYEGDVISMYILLPLNLSATAVTDLLKKIDAVVLQDILNKPESAVGEMPIAIPKFTSDYSLQLTPIMESMGVGDLFQSSADLSSLTTTPGLHLDSAVHKAKITVDEMGSEAAAATAIFANRFASDSFIANHPFIYFLFDKQTNILLFVGIFNSPET